ncbi:MAG: hypothetical protein JOZ56_03585, partial [Actinobacteria bacterium]|nr:hypothetical protein [Actinomycetota bacterium]
MIATTPANVQQAFTAHGAPVVQVAKAPSVCTPLDCQSIDKWRFSPVVWFKPTSGRDFLVALLPTPSDAKLLAGFESSGSDVHVVQNGPTVLVYAN